MSERYYEPKALLAAFGESQMTLRRLAQVVEKDPDTVKKVLQAGDVKLSLLIATAKKLGCNVTITIERAA